jgi:chorismate synthase
MATIEQHPVRCPDAQAAKLMQQAIEAAISEGDSLGGIIETVISNMPAGLGEPVFDKLDAMLAHAIVSIGAVKGIEFGAGFQAAQMKGSECNDAFYCEDKKVKTTTNHAGGILGGISNGQDIIFRCAVKPTPSISKPQQTINTDLANTTIQIHGRHDPCICPRIVPVIEAMTAITLVNLL